MAWAAGPWYLLEPSWETRARSLMARCRQAVADHGYRLHDVEREGEKGFRRLGAGFCTRPDSMAMREHFQGLGDVTTAEKFRPSSMETVRRFGGDPLTLVSEMPLFLLPGVGQTLGPPDPVAQQWQAQIDDWRQQLATGTETAVIHTLGQQAGVRPMPVRDQLSLQWDLLLSGLECIGVSLV